MSGRSGATGRMEERKLQRATALTQLVLLALCAARVAIDGVRGPPSIEGSIALVLLVLLATSLVARAIGRVTRAPVPSGESSVVFLFDVCDCRSERRSRQLMRTSECEAKQATTITGPLILVVDDAFPMQKLPQTVLSANGLRTQEATSAAEV